MLKALLLTNLFPSSQEPTRGVFSLNRFRALSQHCETRVVVPVPWWARMRQGKALLSPPHDASFGLDAWFPTYWSIPRKPSVHARAMHLSLRPFLTRLRREFPFDVILAAWAYPDGVAAAHLAQELGCPLVIMTLGSDINELTRHPALCGQIIWGLEQSKSIVAVSAALRDRMVELGIPREKIIVQHNGVDGERFAIRDREEARARLSLPSGRKLICYIGNFKPEKGPDVLLEAMGHVVRSGRKDVELALVGSGEMEEQLRARSREFLVEDQVRFCGRRPHAEIPDWITACDVLCLPSYREGCPNVVLEALASGRPVVASRVGGVHELLSQDTGLLVPAGDSNALATSLQEVLTRSWDPYSLRASVACLSWDQFGLTLCDVLETALIKRNQVTLFE